MSGVRLSRIFWIGAATIGVERLTALFAGTAVAAAAAVGATAFAELVSMRSGSGLEVRLAPGERLVLRRRL